MAVQVVAVVVVAGLTNHLWDTAVSFSCWEEPGKKEAFTLIMMKRRTLGRRMMKRRTLRRRMMKRRTLAKMSLSGELGTLP